MPSDERAVRVTADGATLDGDLAVPDGAGGVILFCHGSGSSRRSSRNRAVARQLNDAGLATLLFDLLTAEEERVDMLTREHRFDIALLGRRTVGVVDWLQQEEATRRLPIGTFGASTGAAAALIGAAERPEAVGAVVSRGGRPDLAPEHLPRVQAPTLLIVGGRDQPVIGMNEQAKAQLTAKSELAIVPGATHLFEEPGALEEVARLAGQWFTEHLSGD